MCQSRAEIVPGTEEFFLLNLTVVTRHFSFATRKTENSLKREPEGKARDGQQQKLIVSNLQEVGGM